MCAKRIEPGLGQESVWDYPRPPRLEETAQEIEVVHAGVTIARTTRAKRVLETSHPPSYYIPPEDVRMDLLRHAADGASTSCEWKATARYFDVVVGDRVARRAAWSYAAPARGFEQIRDHFAFYAGRVDACFVDGERVTPQEGNFYGGWITSKVVGPFKGGSGTWGW